MKAQKVIALLFVVSLALLFVSMVVGTMWKQKARIENLVKMIDRQDEFVVIQECQIENLATIIDERDEVIAARMYKIQKQQVRIENLVKMIDRQDVEIDELIQLHYGVDRGSIKWHRIRAGRHR